MEKTRDLFKNIRDTKGTFHAKMGTKKDRNGMDLTEAEDIKKRWQEYTEELYKKDLHDPAISIPACASSSPAFLMQYSAYKLNKQDNNAYMFLKGQVRWYVMPISFRIFHSLL